MRFKKFLLCSAFVLAASSSALADPDTPAVAPASTAKNRPAIVHASPDWTGFYMGGTFGGSFGETNQIGDVGQPQGHEGETGYVGGLEFGYNYEYANVVLGIEGDISGNSIRFGGLCTDSVDHRCEMDQQWFYTFRPRIGYDFDGLMPYATGGYAMGAVHTTRYSTATSLDVNDQSAAKSGYSVGGGVEYMLTHHWSTKLEYLYLKFRDTDAPPLTSGADYKLPFSESIIRMGLNYKF